MPGVKLHSLIFIGIVLGMAAGAVLWSVDEESQFFRYTLFVLDLIGKTVFVGSLKMLVAPLIFASIVAGITSLADIRDLGDLGWKAFTYYLATTSLAASIGLILVNVMQPGKWQGSAALTANRASHLQAVKAELLESDKAEIENLLKSADLYELKKRQTELRQTFQSRYLNEIRKREGAYMMQQSETARKLSDTSRNNKTLLDFAINIVSSLIQNPFYALTFNSSLGIIFFAILLGMACVALGAEAAPVADFFQAFNQVIMHITGWIMKISPVAVFCLIASLIAKNGPSVFQSLFGYISTVLLGIAVHVLVLLTICRFFGKLSPTRFLAGIRKAWLIAFSTRSSAATLPATFECVENNLKVDKKISRFMLPVGATMNMDGTALYEGVAVLFLIQMFGDMPDVAIHAGAASTVLIFLTAVLASIGAAAVPDAGLITMVLVANAVGLPEYYLVFIFSVDAFLDMFRTSTNVMGDAAGCIVVSNWSRIKSGNVESP